ncbi:MAG: peptidyl-prolyl cis-trans isomerase [Spirochaetia bacterium]|nr:peptidyl-prolyl cis-trans isomerase [Spirochaetia bacterium]
MPNPVVVFKTSVGDFSVELFENKSPITVKNFLDYVTSSFYDGTIFHRVIPGFVVQGGGLVAGMKEKPNGQPIQNEADNGAKNERGTLSMARTSDPHSATSQFFINLVDNAGLNHSGKNERGWGYCVFGKVVSGMDTVDAIAAVKTGDRYPHQNVPLTDVVVTSATVSQ